MRAIVVQRHGPPDVLQLTEMPDPALGPRQVLIRVAAIGINFADLFMRMGMYPRAPQPPFVPGLEAAGIVEAVGSEAGNAFRIGDRVAALCGGSGAYAEKIAVGASQVMAIPDGFTFAEAAAVPVNYLTAWHCMFEMGNLRAGNRVLIHGAAGGVGIASVQLAQAKGLVTFGTAGSTKQELLRELGVNIPIDYTSQDFVAVVRKVAPEGVEMVMDPIGGANLQRSYECLGKMGRLVVYGFSALVDESGRRSVLRIVREYLRMPTFKPLKLMAQNKAVIGVSLGAVDVDVIRREMEELTATIREYGIKPRIGASYPLSEAAEAHRHMHSRKSIGKVVLLVQ